jgi:hypothetical protein
MNIQDAINSGKNFRRNGGIWLKVVGGDITSVDAMKMYKVTSADIVATDWEVVSEPVEISLEVGSDRYSVHFLKLKDTVEIAIQEDDAFLDFDLTEKDVDKLLDFLYNNTKVGKDRILPF